MGKGRRENEGEKTRGGWGETRRSSRRPYYLRAWNRLARVEPHTHTKRHAGNFLWSLASGMTRGRVRTYVAFHDILTCSNFRAASSQWRARNRVKANLHAAICQPDLSATINREANRFKANLHAAICRPVLSATIIGKRISLWTVQALHMHFL